MHFKYCLLSPFPISPPRVVHPVPLPFASKRVLPYLPSLPTYPHPFHLPQHQVSTGLRASSPTGVRQGSLLLHMCQGAMDYTHGWWLTLWELPRVRVSLYCCSSYGVAIPFSSFNFSSNYFIGVPVVGCEYLHVSVSCW